MTTTKTGDGTWGTERWTYGGTAKGKTVNRVSVWYDQDRNQLVFGVDRGHHYTVGGVYDTEVRRDSRGHANSRRGRPAFVERHPDAAWVAQLEADDYASQQLIATGQLERRAARDPELPKLLAPIEDFAAGLNYTQRDALIAMISRKVYQAKRTGK